MKLVGAQNSAPIAGLEELPGKVNYFKGNDPAKWRTGIPTYGKVKYSQVYPGVDLVYYGNQRQLEYDFVLAPGADPQQIRLAFETVGEPGQDSLQAHRDANGDLLLATGGGEVRLKKPLIYQDIGGQRREISGAFVLNPSSSLPLGEGRDEGVRKGDGVKLAEWQPDGQQKKPVEIGFRLAAYDTSQPLVIDPEVVFSTYFGGSGADYALGIAVDRDGNAYVAGTSSAFPTPNPPSGMAGNEGLDVFVTKLGADASTPVWSTYLGGSGNDKGFGIAVDNSGDAYIIGDTASADFPAVNAQYSDLQGELDAFVFKLSSDGRTVAYSTYLGGNSWDSGRGIAVDKGGSAYVTGHTGSTDFPTTSGAMGTSYGGGGDAFVAKFSADGNTLAWSTYLGGGDSDGGNGIAVDGNGNAYVTGGAWSSDFPIVNAKYPRNGGWDDAFVFKLSSNGQTVYYSTFLGGSGHDWGQGIAVGNNGDAYITGHTGSTNFPITPAAMDTSYGGNEDAFVARLSVDGNTLLYSTYLGGNNWDGGDGIAVDGPGNAYIIGSSGTGSFGTQNALIAKLSADGNTRLWLTYFGGNSEDRGNGIAVDASGATYVVGHTWSSNFPTQNPLAGTDSNGVTYNGASNNGDY